MSPRARWVMPWLALVACRTHAGAGAPSPSRASSTVVGAAVAPEAAADASSSPTSDSERPSLDASSPAPPPAPPPAPSATTDWCIEGLSALDEDICYVLPPGTRPRRLLVYLHGIVPPVADSPQKRTVEGVVRRASERAGVAAIVPRGRRGIGPAQARDWWAWPTTPAAAGALTPGILLRWIDAKQKLESIVGAPFERTYLAGSSNGAYYLTLLVAHGDVPTSDFPVDGFGAMSGGAIDAGAGDRLARAAPRPFYVGYGAYDETSASNGRRLAQILERAGWPVRVAVHPLGHGANEVYLDEAFSFWDAPDGGRAP